MSRALALAAALFVLVPAAQASGATFCVQDPACPAGGIAKATLLDAVDTADLDAVEDTVRIGPGNFTSISVNASTLVHVVGSGVDRTRVTTTGPGEVLNLDGSGLSSVSDLSAHRPADSGPVIRLKDGADATRVRVSAPDSAPGVGGFQVEESGSVLRNVTVELGPVPQASGVSFSADGTITDSTITAGIAIGVASSANVVTATARRVSIRATIGLRPFGDTLNAANVLIRPHPRASGTPVAFSGVDVTNGNDGTNGAVVASHLTIAGTGAPGSIGIQSTANTSTAQPGNVDADISGASISNVPTHLLRTGDANSTADLTVEFSAYDGTKVSNSVGFGTLNTATGNLTAAADPRFVTPGTDFRPRFDSPLLDRARTTEFVTGENPDLAGRTRVRDSDGNGSARADIGAYEYQRLPPVPALSISPLPTLFGSATTFDTSATDPDGDPIPARSVILPSGESSTSAHVVRTFLTPATLSARATATDITGLTASLSKPFEVRLLPGKCANRQTGGPAADRLTGFALGDRLAGAGANDTLRGLAGPDCLGGGTGRDRLDGGSGNDSVSGDSGNDSVGGGTGNDRVKGGSGRDRLNGGSGKDRLDGGKGTDRVKGGSGNDTIKAGPGDSVDAGSGRDRISAANGKRNRINCGKGRDRVVADATDRLKGCERVRLRRKR